MRFLKLTSIILLSLLLTNQAFAWSKVGNGGFVIDCNGNIELFDFYEAKNTGLTYKPIPGNTVRAKVYYLLTKLEKLDPNRARNYRFQYTTYWEKNSTENRNKSIFELDHNDVQDKEKQRDYGIGNISIPKNCVLKLALQQIAPTYTEGDRQGRLKLEIYNRLWDKLNKDLKASLVMHELFYREAILLRFIPNSVGIRRLNALLVSEEFNLFDINDWEEQLKASDFKPMFPNFNHREAKNQVDLETDSGNWPGYKTWSYVSPILEGQIDFGMDKVLNVLSHSPFYYKGYYPEYFTLRDFGTIDFSHLTDRKLKIHVQPKCLFRLSNVKSKLGLGQKLLSLGYDKEGKLIPACKADIASYSHERIVAMQWVKTYLLFNKFSKVPRQMLVIREDEGEGGFSELDIKIGETIRQVSSFKVNLESGKLFDIKLKNFVEEKVPATF